MLLNQFYTTFRIDMAYSSAANGVFQQLTLIDLTKKLSNINQYVLIGRIFSLRNENIPFPLQNHHRLKNLLSSNVLRETMLNSMYSQ